jgi:chemotaxis protein MotB
LRRKPHGGHANHERWLVSYADFITLLFAFFVVMFASTQSDRKKAQQVSASVREALAHGQMSAALSSVIYGRPGEARDKSDAAPKEAAPKKQESFAPRPDLVNSMQTLNAKLADELKAGKVEVKLESRGLVISLREAGFFASGESVIDPASLPALEKVAAVIRALPNPVRLEGHTDSRPIHTARFANNWDLSAARAIAMLELFSGRFGVDVGRMAIAGYADNAPTDTNDTDEGRAHNRRVDVVLLTKDAVAGEPPSADHAAR